MPVLNDPRPQIEFDWEEVNCFLRPQSLLCDDVAPGTGLMLLCLASLYQGWGVDGFFGFPGRGFFSFVESVFTPLSGVEFDRSFVDDREAVVDAVVACLADGPVIVPSNCRHLPYFKEYGREDKPHFFIVTGVDAAGDTFHVLDYLHVRDDNLSLEYAPTTLSRGMLDRVTGEYWQTWVGAAPPTAEWEPRYWLLRVRGTGCSPSPDDVPALLLAECARLLDQVETGPPTGFAVDDRYLTELRSAQEAEDEDWLQLLMERYLADANAALVHVKIIDHALRSLGAGSAAPDLAALVEDYRTRSTAARSKVMVRCMVAPSLPQAEWDAFHGELAELGAAFRRRVRSAIPKSF